MFNYKRWRHTRGFGVHSPFAFSLCQEVVRPSKAYSYYGYSDIEASTRIAPVSPRIRREARMFLRLLVKLHPESIFIPNGVEPIFHTAAVAASRRMRIERKPKNAPKCRMITTHADFIPLDVLRSHLATAGNSVVLHGYLPGWETRLFEELKEGLMLVSPRNAILIAREGMQKISYTMSF